ncbi:hypothetical protein TWF696_004086 [Orbilia brochopaga]|uniref:Uncharacterized protein n=1 Tax=Orbilia brochopaga TaxID=3140254 RepID=A0AAV9V8T2_9PEZI
MHSTYILEDSHPPLDDATPSTITSPSVFNLTATIARPRLCSPAHHQAPHTSSNQHSHQLPRDRQNPPTAMQRKLPPRRPATARGHCQPASPGAGSDMPANRFSDIPAEYREMLADNVREARDAATTSQSSQRQQSPSSTGEAAPKRKKPLTRRTAAPAPAASSPATKGGEAPPLPTTGRGGEKNDDDENDTPRITGSLKGKGPAVQAASPEAATTDFAQESGSSEEESDSSASEFGSDGEVEWETVDLSNIKPKDRGSEGPVVFELTAAEPQTGGRKATRTAPTPVERKIRLEVHKLHLLCLLSHAHTRSRFCSDAQVQAAVLPLLSRQTVAELNDTSLLQATVFRQGLANAAAAFRRAFKITRPGARKALWGNIPASFDAMWGDAPMGLEEFRRAAKARSGSRDLAVQLFCAMLRRAGLETRLVCSLQPLSYHFKGKYGVEQTPRKGLSLVEEDKNDYHTSDEEDDGDDGGKFAGNVNKTFGGPGRANFRAAPVAPRRTGGAASSLAKAAKKRRAKQVVVHDPALPIWWVEVFDEPHQEWITVDLFTGIVRNLRSLEPPMADAWENEMAYVVAFDGDHKVRDVTVKYVKHFNSHTRTLRVEATLDGDKWWQKALRPFSRPKYLPPLARDQIEDGMMNTMLLREGIPTSLAAMKNHPVFAIEEQLRQNEVIWPKVSCGTMPGKNKRPVPVYRRQDVKQVKTATQWYMLGREIKAGAQPLKHKKARAARRRATPDDEFAADDDGESQDTGMYSYDQTIKYQPEPCIGPLVPRNAFGNIDLYVPSMLPAGGVHIPHKLARIAANFLGIGDDVADAVTGFDFRTGGKSTPVITGVVAAVEHEDAIWAMIESIEREQEVEEAEKLRVTVLNLWRRFLLVLRIKERVDEYAEDDEEDVVTSKEMEEPHTEAADATTPADDGEPAAAGGFFTTDIEEFAGNTMRGEAKRKREVEEQEMLNQAKARRKRLAELQQQQQQQQHQQQQQRQQQQQQTHTFRERKSTFGFRGSKISETQTAASDSDSDDSDLESVWEEYDPRMFEDAGPPAEADLHGRTYDDAYADAYGTNFAPNASDERPLTVSARRKRKFVDVDKDHDGADDRSSKSASSPAGRKRTEQMEIEEFGGGFLADGTSGGGFIVEEEASGGGFIVEYEAPATPTGSLKRARDEESGTESVKKQKQKQEHTSAIHNDEAHEEEQQSEDLEEELSGHDDGEGKEGGEDFDFEYEDAGWTSEG